jgi:hypothetical protein
MRAVPKHFVLKNTSFCQPDNSQRIKDRRKDGSGRKCDKKRKKERMNERKKEEKMEVEESV